MVSWKELQGPALSIATAINQAVDAVGARDRDAYERATAELASASAGPAGQVLGALLRSLLEEQHPDGLDSDDIQTVLGLCYRDAAGWLPADRLDVAVLLAALASALGIHEPGVTYEDITGPRPGEETDDPFSGYAYGGSATETVPTRVPTAAQYAWHAPLLIADLVAAGRRPLGRYLDAAFTEIARAETMELP